jgi:hypothetical protein
LICETKNFKFDSAKFLELLALINQNYPERLGKVIMVQNTKRYLSEDALHGCSPSLDQCLVILGKNNYNEMFNLIEVDHLIDTFAGGKLSERMIPYDILRFQSIEEYIAEMFLKSING